MSYWWTTPMHASRALFFLIVFSTLLNPRVSQAEHWSVSSSAQQALVVELFTSEGCSSCPPADRWLSGLKSRQDLFKTIIPVAYHVTYWDYLGWQDTFGLSAHNDRHRRQAAATDAGVYTPGVFLQGNEWRGWRRHPEGPVQQKPANVGVLRARPVDEHIEVTFAPTTSLALTAPEVFVVYLRMEESTQVRAGENRGRKLAHDFVAGAVAMTSMQRRSGQWHAVLTPVVPPEADAVAIWVKDVDGAYLQAGGTYIKPPA